MSGYDVNRNSPLKWPLEAVRWEFRFFVSIATCSTFNVIYPGTRARRRHSPRPTRSGPIHSARRPLKMISRKWSNTANTSVLSYTPRSVPTLVEFKLFLKLNNMRYPKVRSNRRFTVERILILSDGRFLHKMQNDYHSVAEKTALREAVPNIFHNLLGAVQAITI